MFVCADVDQRSDDVAKHVMEKCVGGEIEADERTLHADIDVVQRLDRRLRLTFRSAKRGEIVRARKLRRRDPHRFDVERCMVPAHASPQQRGPLRSHEHPVRVVTRGGSKTRVKIVGYGLGPQNGSGRRQKRVDAADPCARRSRFPGIEVDDLRCRVNAGIGSARGIRGDHFAGNFAERPLEGVLYTASR